MITEFKSPVTDSSLCCHDSGRHSTVPITASCKLPLSAGARPDTGNSGSAERQLLVIFTLGSSNIDKYI